MPLDRFVIVRTTVSGVNDFGETVETSTDHRVWAQLLQDGIARAFAGAGGAYADADRVWRVRFNQAFLDAIANEGRVLVIYDDVDALEPPGEGDTISRIAEPTGTGDGTMVNRRRRFLDLLS